MSAKRRFDHDEAIELRAAGWTWVALAGRYGVTPDAVSQAVRRATDPEWAERQRMYKRAYRLSAECYDCGAACTRMSRPSQGAFGVALCTLCANKRRRTRFVFDDAGEVVGARCSGGCGEIRPLDEFPGGIRYRDVRPNGVHRTCRACHTRRRREQRARNPEADRAYDRAYRRRKRSQSGAA